MSGLRAAAAGAILVLALSAGLTATAGAASTEYVAEHSLVESETGLKSTTETGTTNALAGTPFGVTVHVECSKRELSGSINAAGAGATTIKFSSCSATKPANCTVSEPITVETSTQAEENGTLLQTEFKPKSGTTFTEVSLLGASCSLKGKPFKVEGTQTCENGSNAEVEKKEHKLECLTTGSSLTAGGKVATFASSEANLELVGGTEWSLFGGGSKDVYSLNPNPTMTFNDVKGEVQNFKLTDVGKNELTLASSEWLLPAPTAFSLTDVNKCLGGKLKTKAFCAVSIQLVKEETATARYTGQIKFSDGLLIGFTRTVRN